MHFGFADPPYLGQGKLYARHHPDAHVWDSADAHRQLIERLQSSYADGWAVCLSVPALDLYLSCCPRSCRLCSWCKPFAVFKPHVGLAYTWEPVIVCGGRKRTRNEPTCRDHLVENITLKKGLPGAKPLRFNQWILGLLNWQADDVLDDLFPGTGGMSLALNLGVQDLGGPRNPKKPRLSEMIA